MKLIFLVLLIIFIILIFRYIYLYIKNNRQVKGNKNSIYVSENILNLPVNRFPWIGSHDSATGFTGKDDIVSFLKLRSIPFLKTQSLNFKDQYQLGNVRFFDLRVGIPKNQEIHFYHGPIKIQKINKDQSFKDLINQAITDKELIVLWFNHYTDHKNTTQQIKDEIDKYLKKQKIDEKYISYLSNLSELDNTYKYFQDNEKYILIILGDNLVISNWNEKITCFPGDNTNCLLDINSKPYQNLLRYIVQKENEYQRLEPKKFFITQSFFQAPYNMNGYITASLKNLAFSQQVIKTNINSKLDNELIKFYKDNMIKSNVTLLDNVNEKSKELYSTILSSFEI